MIRNIQNLFDQEKEDYYKPIRVGTFWKIKAIPIEGFFKKTRRYLNDIIDDLKKSDTQKIQLTIAINFISSKDIDKERIMHLNNDNIEIMINDRVDNFLNHFLVDIKLGQKHQ